MPLASRQLATGGKDFIWTSGNWLQGEAAAETGHSMPDKGQAGEILQRMAADSSEACGEMHGKPKTSESDLFGYRQTQMGHLRFLLGESSSIRKMIFRFQLPLYLENSS